MRILGIMLMVVALGLVAGCDSGSDVGPEGPEQGQSEESASTSAMGPGISVQQARASDLEGPLLVNGFRLTTGGTTLFCESLSTSRPPQCIGDRVRVQGLPPDSLQTLEVEDDIRWSSARMQLLGSIEGDTLVLDPRARG